MADFIVDIDGTSHKLGEDETTLCGIVVPQASEFTREPGEKSCSTCFPKGQYEQELDKANHVPGEYVEDAKPKKGKKK